MASVLSSAAAGSSSSRSAAQLQQLLQQLRAQVALLHRAAADRQKVGDVDAVSRELRRENGELAAKADRLNSQLLQLQMRNGTMPVALLPIEANVDVKATTANVDAKATTANVDAKAKTASVDSKVKTANVDSKANADSKSKAKPKPKQPAAAAGAADTAPIDIRRLDLRVGRISLAEKHPDADSLYVETVDVGEERARTIVSGLAKHVPLPEMQQRLAVFLLNLKPAKMRGVLSEGMIMCASSSDGRVEILTVPEGAQPGQRVRVGDFPNDAPDAQLNPKKKIWEALKPKCLVDADGFATFGGVRWGVDGCSGFVTAKSLREAQIS